MEAGRSGATKASITWMGKGNGLAIVNQKERANGFVEAMWEAMRLWAMGRMAFSMSPGHSRQ